MNRTEYLLECFAEECAEVAQRVSKANRFGLNEIQPEQPLTNRQRLHGEFIQLMAVGMLLEREGILPRLPHHAEIELINAKCIMLEKTMRYSIECGTLVDPEFNGAVPPLQLMSI